jgi:hypothetical protein
MSSENTHSLFPSIMKQKGVQTIKPLTYGATIFQLLTLNLCWWLSDGLLLPLLVCIFSFDESTFSKCEKVINSYPAVRLGH